MLAYRGLNLIIGNEWSEGQQNVHEELVDSYGWLQPPTMGKWQDLTSRRKSYEMDSVAWAIGLAQGVQYKL